LRRNYLGPLAVAAVLAWNVSGCGNTTAHVAVAAPEPTTATTATSNAVGSGGKPSSNPPHPLVCGKILSTSAVNVYVEDIAGGHLVATLPGITVGGKLFVRVSHSCVSGSTTVITPSNAFHIIRTVRATDGLAVAIEIRRVVAIGATVSATSSSGGHLGTLRLPRSR
jgi:hypothetical protein